MEMKFPIILHGKVLHGNKLGRSVDIPTANIIPDKDISDLPYGVYFSRVLVDGKYYKSITNLGVKPTVKDDDSINAETFIYDYKGDLYEKEITVKLLSFKRPEMKFDSFEALSIQMQKDLDEGRNFTCDLY